MEEFIYISSEENIIVNDEIVKFIVKEMSASLDFEIESLELNFVSNETILEINKEHLDHHYYTDIITFNYSGENDNLDGEIFISLDEALENAKRFECENKSELLRLVVHGILHMCGYDDMNDDDKKIMKEKEDAFVKRLDPEIEKEFVVYEN